MLKCYVKKVGIKPILTPHFRQRACLRFIKNPQHDRVPTFIKVSRHHQGMYDNLDELYNERTT